MELINKEIFRFASKRAFLSYNLDNFDISMDILYNSIKDIFSRYGIINYALVKKRVINENFDFYLVISLEKRIDITTYNFFDLKLNLEEKVTIIKPVDCIVLRSEKSTLVKITNHLLTEEDFKLYSLISPGYRDIIHGYSKKNKSNLDIELINLAQQGQIKEAMSLVEKEDPKLFLRLGTIIENRLMDIHLQNIGMVKKYNFDSFQIPSHVQEALNLFEQAIKLKHSRGLIIQGPSRTGKTQFLKAYLEQKLNLKVFMASTFNALKDFKPYKYNAILLDDASLSNIPREKLISLFDNENRDIVVQYKTIKIAANTVKAVTTNSPFKELNKHFKDNAIRRRVIFIKLNEGDSFFNPELTLAYLDSIGSTEDSTSIKELEILNSQIEAHNSKIELNSHNPNKINEKKKKKTTPLVEDPRYPKYLEESNLEFEKLKNSYEGKYYDIEDKYGVNNPIEKSLVDAKYNLSKEGISPKKIGYYQYKKKLLKEQEEVLKEYFNRAEKIRYKEKNQNDIDFGIFFLLKILNVLSKELQETVKFYSIVYKNVELDDVNDSENCGLIYVRIPTSKKFMEVIYCRSTLIVTAYSVLILFFPGNIFLLKLVNKFFGVMSFKFLITNIIKTCFSSENPKEKLKRIFFTLKNVMCNLILVSALNIILLTVLEMIKFEINLSIIDRCSICKNNTEKKKIKFLSRKNFYWYLGITLLILICRHYGLGFSIGSNSENEAENEAEKKTPESGENGSETDNKLSRLMRYLGYQNMFETWQLFDSLTDAEKEKILIDLKDIEENDPNIVIYAALFSALLVFLAALSGAAASHTYERDVRRFFPPEEVRDYRKAYEARLAYERMRYEQRNAIHERLYGRGAS